MVSMLDSPKFRFCPYCGSPIVLEQPAEDVRVREVCPQCGYIHYVNPIPVVGTVPICGDKVLLCRRAIEPRKGYWTLPAGFMEAHETLEQGACRETLEETGELVQMGPILTLIDVPDASQIHVFFLSYIDSLTAHPGPETIEQRLFAENEIPWDEISFTTVRTTLEHFFSDRRKGHFVLHHYQLPA